MITQGTLFSNAISSEEDEYNRLGLLISARCDIANKKQSRYHYIPVLTFFDWMAINVIPIHCKERLLSCCNRLGSQVKEKSYKTNLLRYTKSKDLHSLKNLQGLINFIELLQAQLELPKQQKISDSVSDVLEIANEMIGLTNTKLTEQDTLEYISKYEKKEFDKIAKRLLDGFQGYYFIGSVNNLKGQYVAELREIYTVSKEFVHYLGTNNEISEKALNVMQDISLGNLRTSEENVLKYAVVGEVQSPMIESIMQKFGINFIRVGIDYEDFIYCH